MENKETIKALVKDIEEKESKSGRIFWSIETDKGKFSCFEKEIVEAIGMNGIGKICNLDIASSEDGKFQNVRSWDGKPEEAKKSFTTAKASVKPAEPDKCLVSQDKFAEAREEKNRSIYVSYAKDIFIELVKIDAAEKKEYLASELMKSAINLIKQAAKEF